MCGFVGVYLKNRINVPENWIIAMNKAISHRGPDDSNVEIMGNVALGHRRLSIIDIEGGKQPMQDHKNRSWIVYNGEIYNFKEIRKTLEQSGVVFKSNSDTEVLVNNLSHNGKGCIKELNGMFGFAYYEPYNDYLILARDHLGIKPVYYFENNDCLAFASEIKSLLSLPFIDFEIDVSLLEELLTFRFIAGNNTLFKNIKQLAPGQILELKNNKSVLTQYWDLPTQDSIKTYTENEAISLLDDKLNEIIKLQEVSDVPLGTFLSGGVDSGVVTAIASKHKRTPLDTFVVGFESPEYDERSDSYLVSSKYNTRHHEYVMDGSNLMDRVRALSYFNDEPISHPNTVPLYFLSRNARSEVKVILTGEGADEMLSGYPRHLISKYRDALGILPSSATQLAGSILSHMPNRKLKMLGNGLKSSEEDALIFNSQFVDNSFVKKLISRDIISEGLTFRRKYANHLVSDSIHRRLMVLDVKTYLVSALHRMDRMSMANGLECRVPFLDYRLVEWVLQLDSKYKIKNNTNKYILKKLSERYLNKSTIYKPKSGFGLPLASWFRDDNALKPFLNEMSNSNNILSEYFDRKMLSDISTQHINNKSDNSELLWILLCFYNWCEVFSSDISVIRDKIRNIH